MSFRPTEGSGEIPWDPSASLGMTSEEMHIKQRQSLILFFIRKKAPCCNTRAAGCRNPRFSQLMAFSRNLSLFFIIDRDWDWNHPELPEENHYNPAHIRSIPFSFHQMEASRFWPHIQNHTLQPMQGMCRRGLPD